MLNLHFIAGFSSFYSLKEAFKQSEKDIVCPLFDYLTMGPLNNIDKNLNKRIEYFKKIYSITKQIDEFSFIRGEIGLNSLIKYSNTNDNIYYYFCENNTNEMLYLRAICYYFKDKNLNLINLNKTLNNKDIISSAQIEPNILKRLTKLSKIIKIEDHKILAKQWEDLLKKSDVFRLILNNKIVSQDSSYFDNLIIDNCKTSFYSAAKICGKTLGQLNIELSDLFINYRIRYLINNGTLIAKEENTQLQNLMIKK